jgi:hypothetical protein
MSLVLNPITGQLQPASAASGDITESAFTTYAARLRKTIDLTAGLNTILGSSFTEPLKRLPVAEPRLTDADGLDLGLTPYIEENADGIHYDVKIYADIDRPGCILQII